MKKIILGLFIIVTLLFTACSPEGYVQLAEKMGKMNNNIYGIKANMSDVNDATEVVNSSVSITTAENGDVTVTIDFTETAKIMNSVAKVKDSEQKTEALKEELSKPVVDETAKNAVEQQAAVKAALEAQAASLAADVQTIITSVETNENLTDGQKELLNTVKSTIESVQISDNPTKAELTTIAVLTEIANTVQIIATTEDLSTFVSEEGLTEEGLSVADTALSSLDTLKMVSEVANIDLLGDISLSSLMSSFGDTSRDLSPEVQQTLGGFATPINSIVKLFTDSETNQFDLAKFKITAFQARAVKSSYELLAVAYGTPSTVEDVDIILAKNIDHGLTMSDFFRYVIAVAIVTADEVSNGIVALQDFLNAEYEDLTNGNFENLELTEDFEALWNSIKDSFTVTDTTALRTLATLAVIMKDAEYTDLLYLNGNDGKISTFMSTILGE